MRSLYEIIGHLYEEHGEYKCYLAVWSSDTTVKSLLFNLYEPRLLPSGVLDSEHDLIVEVIMTALRRNAEKHERSLL